MTAGPVTGASSHASAAVTPRHDPIAIVGMRCRVPGADDPDQMWHNLAEGVESITPLTADEIRASGIPDNIARLPGYVNAAPLLGDVDMFDAGFFGFSARDAALTDPQHRLFLETAWEALEDSGHDPAAFPGSIGVFGGCELSTYLYQLYQHPEALGYIDGMQLMVTNDKDHLCTQVSYRLNLRGPSVCVQTTCSTSLVAISLACESLQAGHCDMALAGGVTVRVPQRGGYMYVAGSILSPDGHCRPFDAQAQGTIVGSGVGLVVLKRLKDALADRDSIRAVILGSGINNDGNDKVGYTAPGFRGQAAALRAAYDASGVSPETVGYIEAHGTGTILGDPIEVSALTEVFREHTDKRGYCGIGSVKSNFGHLSCAAGVTGLIKTVLTLEHGAIPPTVHYRSPNPSLDIAASPFYVTTRLQPWPRNGTPRRAGVSSFGVGGTNVHAVLEEPPALETPPTRRSHQLLTLSARTATALETATVRLGEHLDRRPEQDLADVAHTLHIGRRAFPYRRSVLVPVDEGADAAARLLAAARLPTVEPDEQPTPVVFMFPGQGSQYPGMAADLYADEPVVTQTIDDCCLRLEPHLGLDLRDIVFPRGSRRESAADELRNTAHAQPALFVVEYALAQLWLSWGVRPAAVIGHSIGEYVSAVLAGVMDLEDALRLIALRGRLIANLPRGSMLAVMSPAESLESVLGDDVSLAAVNAPALSVLSGPAEAIEQVGADLEARSIPVRHLHTSHAFHSAMMEPMLEEFESIVGEVELGHPTIPYVATLTGDWADGEVSQPAYWSRQVRSTVRFGDGLRTLAAPDGPIGAGAAVLEIGPGRSLTTFAAQSASAIGSAWLSLPTLPGTEEQRSGTELTLAALGSLWERRVPVDWYGFHAIEPRRRVSLPTYPFERESYWIGRPVRAGEVAPAEERDVTDWFSQPTWVEAEPPTLLRSLEGSRILVLDEGTGLGAAVVDRLRAAGAVPLVAGLGSTYSSGSDSTFTVDPAEPESFVRLAADVCGGGRLAGVVDCWAAGPPGETDIDEAALISFLGPTRLSQALTAHSTARPLPVLLVARGSERIGASDPLDPARAFGLGVARVLPQEHPAFRVARVDVDGHPDVAEQLLAELAAGIPEPEVAMRDGRRYLRHYDPLPIPTVEEPDDLPADPVVMVTGGIGHMGMHLAEALFERMGARLVLVGRSQLPDPDHWAAAAESPATKEDTRSVLRRLAAMHEKRDAVVVLQADLGDPVQVAAAVDAAVARFGGIDIVVHGAANVSPAAFGPIAETGPSVVAAQISPKITGLYHLMAAMRGREPRRWVIHGSISAVLGGLGLAAYAGANAVLNAIVMAGGPRWLSIEWDAWDNAGEAQAVGTVVDPPTGQESFLRLLGSSVSGRVVVAAHDLLGRIENWVRGAGGTGPAAGRGGAQRHPRPALTTPYLEPRTDTERGLADIWASQLGLDRVGVNDRFFDLGGHSLLAVQVASEIRDRFGVEMPVLQLFKAPTIGELAGVIDQAGDPAAGIDTPAPVPAADSTVAAAPDHPAEEEGPGGAAKAAYREFYDDVSRRLERTGMAEASFFLNYGYVSQGSGDEITIELPDGEFNLNSIRLACELVGSTDLRDRRVLDVGSGRGGTVALLAERFGARAVGMDLSPEAVAFCRRTHRAAEFEVGDAENLPFDDASFDVVTNLESSHTYPDMRAFLTQVRRVLKPGGWFLHTDLLAGQRWMEVQVILQTLGFTVVSNRDITRQVLASCDQVADSRTQAFGAREAAIDNFLAVPGSPVYEQMASGAWEYRILRSRLG